MKTRKLFSFLLAVALVFGMMPLTAMAAYDPAEYDPGDVAVINAIIENNGLLADKDDPVAWENTWLVIWDSSSTPKRVEILYLESKNLTGTLDVSGLTELKTLFCGFNDLTGLNVTNNTALTTLSCNENQLTSLDVSSLSALEFLGCSENKLTSLDVSANAALTMLSCYTNQLTSLDVLANTLLTDLDCSANELTSLDVSKNTALLYLDCSVNQLTSLNVSQNTVLENLVCYSNQIRSLDLSKNLELGNLNCSDNYLTSLDLLAQMYLWGLDCSYNYLTADGALKMNAIEEGGQMETPAVLEPQREGTPPVDPPVGPPTPPSSSSDDGGSGSGSMDPVELIKWITRPIAKKLAKFSVENSLPYSASRGTGKYGIRANAGPELKGLQHRHDTAFGGVVQVRITFPNPEMIDKDTMISAYLRGVDADAIRARFARFYDNTFDVIHCDQRADWKQVVRIAAKINLTGMDTANLYFYSYNPDTNTFRRIADPKYRIDANGYVHFSTPYAGDIIVSSGPLFRL